MNGDALLLTALLGKTILFQSNQPVYQKADGHDDANQYATAHQNNQQSEQILAQVEARVNDIVDITAFLEEVFDYWQRGRRGLMMQGPGLLLVLQGARQVWRPRRRWKVEYWWRWWSLLHYLQHENQLRIWGQKRRMSKGGKSSPPSCENRVNGA